MAKMTTTVPVELLISGDLDRQTKPIFRALSPSRIPVGRIIASGVFAFATGAAAAGAAALTAVNAFRREEASMAKLQAAIVATGREFDTTSRALEEQAEALQRMTTFTDDAVIELQAILVTFKRLGEEVLPETTEIALDISILLGTEARSVAIQLGKALNDPISQLDGLARVGIRFNEEQKKYFQALVESGRIQEAQKAILGQLRGQFGGAARAGADGTGSFIVLRNQIEELVQELGRSLAPEMVLIIEKLLAFTETLQEGRENLFLAKVAIDATGRQIFSAINSVFEAMFNKLLGAIELGRGLGDAILGRSFERIKIGLELLRTPFIEDVREIGKSHRSIADETFNAAIERRQIFQDVQENAARLRAKGELLRQSEQNKITQTGASRETAFKKRHEELLERETELRMESLRLADDKEFEQKIFDLEREKKTLELERDLVEKRLQPHIDNLNLQKAQVIIREIAALEAKNAARRKRLASHEKIETVKKEIWETEFREQLELGNLISGGIKGIEAKAFTAKEQLVFSTLEEILGHLQGFGKTFRILHKALEIAKMSFLTFRAIGTQFKFADPFDLIAAIILSVLLPLRLGLMIALINKDTKPKGVHIPQKFAQGQTGFGNNVNDFYDNIAAWGRHLRDHKTEIGRALEEEDDDLLEEALPDTITIIAPGTIGQAVRARFSPGEFTA